jgi:hypothetical protein
MSATFHLKPNIMRLFIFVLLLCCSFSAHAQFDTIPPNVGEVWRWNGSIFSADTLPLNGDLTGNSERAKVKKLQGVEVSTSEPIDGQMLIYSGTSLKYEPSLPKPNQTYNTITGTLAPIELSGTKTDNFINQGGTQATFTFSLPGSVSDGFVSRLVFNNAVTSLTINSADAASIFGTVPITASAYAVYTFKFYTGIGWIRTSE